MKRLYIVLVCILLTISTTISVSAASSVPEPVMKATESVVRVLAEYSNGYSTGSGFVIKSDKEETLIATNYHVVEGKPYSISVWLGEEETVSARVLAYTNQKDMCILKLAYPVSLKPLLFAENGAKKGDAVYAVGFPGAADYLSDKEAHTSADATITDGIVSAVREATVSSYGTSTRILQINAAINSGNSGGPLFNINGEVTGINTYGIDNSQGIFGAIEITELKAFMADHSIPVPEAEDGYPWWIVTMAAAVIIGAVSTIAIVVRKKKMKDAPKVEVKKVPLNEYMASHSDGVGDQNAVAMLLPVALQLRDMHNNGCIHLEVSPNSISVGENGAALNSATSSEANRYTSGFAAPEIYTGTPAGYLSDIYSFCAVLSFVATGKVPVNSLSRTNDTEGNDTLEQAEDPFEEILKTGMALDAANRTASMQEIIIKLSPYNVRPFTNAATITEQNAPMKPQQKKSRISIKKIISFVAVALAVILVGTYLGCYMGARIKAKDGNFDTASNLLLMPSITKLHDPDLIKYISAGDKLDDRQYTEAKKMFEDLSGYLNADEFALEADYRYAVQCADSNNFSKAISTMEVLGKNQYKDSDTKLLEFQYRHGVYLLLEESKFADADRIFTELAKKKYDGAEEMRKETQYLWAASLIENEDFIGAYKKLTGIKSYSDVKDVLYTLEEVIYLEGQRLYYDEKFSDAETHFNCVSSYGDSKKYLILIDARGKDALLHPEETAKKLTDIFYFEDASELLVSSTDVACYFLLGKWTTSGGSYYFEMELTDDGDHGFWSSYNLPWYGGSFIIENGVYSVSNNSYEDKPQFRFTLLSPDCMEVYCYKNGSTYTLYR